jgi:hypothetical protein
VKLVCHIGTPKTASTFLQNTCAANLDWLARHGVIYPDLMSRDANHITLFYAASEGLHDFARDHGLTSREDVLRFREEIDQALARQVAEAPEGAHTMLISSPISTRSRSSSTCAARTTRSSACMASSCAAASRERPSTNSSGPACNGPRP